MPPLSHQFLSIIKLWLQDLAISISVKRVFLIQGVELMILSRYLFIRIIQ
ncbi:hypothetical protein DFP95_101854 [Cohnella lupini]|uniref:Uncharacterized protein n=1 Tax=Cohnella lupini TaxID=1294267 RepID=A0A3D9IXB6_9BACL|nr:hypothetical protein DFP95_101854 [Cohnella lupini]